MMEFAKRRIGQTDLIVPTLGFGGAPLGGLFDPVNKSEAEVTLKSALAEGLSYVDTAPYYGFGRSERLVGDLLRGHDYVLSTKVGRLMRPGPTKDAASMGWPDALPFHPVFDYSYDGIRRSFEDSLQRLGLNKIDILYVHDIEAGVHGADISAHWRDLEEGGYRALAELRAEGAVKAIGLGVNESAACMNALSIGDWDAFLLAGRYTLLEQEPLDDLLPACKASGTSIVIGGPFNSGILAGGQKWNYGNAPGDIQKRVAELTSHCQEHSVPMAAAALQFPLGHEMVASVIPGLRSPKELVDALHWAQLDIPKAFWASLKDNGFLHPVAPVPDKNPFKE